MSKVWYCPNCGYEVAARGRCHQCRQRLVASPLPELAPGDEADEVGYRIDDWTDSARGWLITTLIDGEIPHRFEADELVVSADDEAAVDDLVAQAAIAVASGGPDGLDGDELPREEPTGVTQPGDDLPDHIVMPAVELLRGAAARLHRDPTDMQADIEVAEASAVVFQFDAAGGLDAEEWAAVGRVTRRLLSALGAEEALEEEIRHQAGLLGKLLEAPVSGPALLGGAPPTIYELAEWLPEQRAELSLLLDEDAIAHRWDGDDLLVPTAREPDVERLFDRVAPMTTTEEEDDDRYRALEELFAAADRLANAPADEDRAAELVARVEVVEGATPVGFADAQWWTIRSKARALAAEINSDGRPEAIGAGAAELRDLLRAMV